MARGAATEKAETAAAAAPAGGASDNSRALPLAKRSVDALLSFWFLMFAFSTTFTDIHNFTASWLGVEVVALEHMKLLWPPPVLTQVYFRWARTVDPLLYQNPVFWYVSAANQGLTSVRCHPTLHAPPQAVHRVGQPAVPYPFRLCGCFPAGLELGAHPRDRRVILHGVLTRNLHRNDAVSCRCRGSAAAAADPLSHTSLRRYGPERSADPSTFTGIYIIYLLQPLVVIARLWHDRPFSRLHGGWNAVLCTATLVNMAVFFSYVAKWMVLYEPGVLGPLLPHLLPAAQLP